MSFPRENALRRHFVALAICSLFCANVPASARRIAGLNDWQKTVVAIGKQITAKDFSGSSWIVEYNSSFPDVDVGLVLAPASYDRNASSMNIVAVCRPSVVATISTDGRDFAEFTSNRQISFSAGASPPPAFVLGSLRQANAALSVVNNSKVTFDLSDVRVTQLVESDALDAINAPDCFRRIRHRSDVFYVRGQYLMRLVMHQNRSGTGNVGAALNNAANSPMLGFSVNWNRSLDWKIEQTKPRPWFRIVSHFRLSRDKTRFELVQ